MLKKKKKKPAVSAKTVVIHFFRNENHRVQCCIYLLPKKYKTGDIQKHVFSDYSEFFLQFMNC